jgi:hypothetical protein
MSYEFVTSVTADYGDGSATTFRVAEAGQASVEEPHEAHHTVKGSGASLGLKPTLSRGVSPDKNFFPPGWWLDVWLTTLPPQNVIVSETVQIV